jgi:hypothetical protein
MAKSVQEIAKALKLKAEPREEALTLRLGTKKHVLPFEVRILTSNDYVFVHIPPSAGIMKITSNGLVPVVKADEANNAVQSFRQRRKKTTRTTQKVAIPDELASALKKLPNGYKLAYGTDGSPKLVRARNRSK